MHAAALAHEQALAQLALEVGDAFDTACTVTY